MPDKLHSLLKEIQGLEQSVEAEIHRLQKGAAFHVHDGKVSFNKEMLRIHRTFKKGIGKYLSESNFLFILEPGDLRNVDTGRYPRYFLLVLPGDLLPDIRNPQGFPKTIHPAGQAQTRLFKRNRKI